MVWLGNYTRLSSWEIKMNKEKNVKKAFIWNMIGSTSYSVSSFLYLMVVTRISGVELAGFFSLVYATAQLLLTVGRYGMRTYQATDLRQKYLFSEYGISRIITCAVMMAFGIAYSCFSFRGEYVIISCFIILMKMIDAVEDVFHGNFQQQYNVEVMGKMLAVRNIYSALAFTLLLYVSRDLNLTCILTSLTSLILCIFINNSFTRKYLVNIESGHFQMAHVWELLKICTPLFAGTFLSLFLYNVPKYAMVNILSDEYQTYYSILFMPSFVITLMCEFVFKPMITTIAELWWEEELKRFVRYVLRIIGIIAVCCGGIVVAGHLLGRTLLELIYGVSLEPYKLHFIVLLVGGGIGATVYMMYNILIAIRKGKCIIAVYSITAIFTVLPARWMVKEGGIMGAAFNYLYSCSILFLLFAVILIYVVCNKKKKCKSCDLTGRKSHG